MSATGASRNAGEITITNLARPLDSEEHVESRGSSQGCRRRTVPPVVRLTNLRAGSRPTEKTHVLRSTNAIQRPNVHASRVLEGLYRMVKSKTRVGEPPSKTSLISTVVGPASLALSAYAGQLKENRLLSWLPFDLTVASVALVILTSMHSRFSHGPANNFVIFPFIIWTLFIPAVFFTVETDYANTKVVTLFTITFALAVAPFYLLRTIRQRTVFLSTLIAISLFAAVYVSVLDQDNEDLYATRLILGGTDTIGTGRLAMTGALIAAVFVLGGKHKLTIRVIFLSISIVGSLLALSSGSRGPAVAVLIAIVTILLTAPLFKLRRPWAIGGFFVIANLVLWFAISVPSDGVTRVLSIFTGETDTSTNARLRLWSEAWHQIGERPLGSGWGGFDAYTYSHRYPHNILLEIGVEAGIFVAAVVFATGVFAAIRAKTLSFNATHCAMFSLLVFAVVNAMVSSDINGARLLTITLFAAFSYRSFSHGTITTEFAPRGPHTHPQFRRQHTVNIAHNN